MQLKNNDLQKFEELPTGWKLTTLGQVLPISYGKGLTKASRESGTYPVFGSSGRVGQHSKALTAKPSLIIGRKGSVGEVHYSTAPCWPIDTVYFAEEREGIELKYFEYLLKGLNLAKLDKSTAVPGLSRDDYNAVEVAVAPLDQQQRIVAEIEKQFSRLDEAVANLKRVKANLKRYKAAVLKAAVEGKLAEEWRKQHPDGEPASELLKRILAERRTTWNGRGEYKEPAAPDATDLWPLPGGWIWATVEQLSTLVQYGSSAKCSEEAKGVPVLRMGNIENGKLLLNKLKYLPKDHDEFPSLFLSAGDLLFNRTNSAELVGKMAVYRGTPTPCSFASYLIRVRLSKHCVSDFLSYYINSVYGRSWIAKVVSQQVGQANVNGTKLQALPVPLLPLAEQERIVAEVERQLSLIEKLEATADATLDHGDRLRQSVLGDVFSGQLAQRNAYARSGVGSDLPMAAEGDGIYKSNR